jgi:hypothetical protein
MSKTNSMVSMLADDLQSGDHSGTGTALPTKAEKEQEEEELISSVVTAATGEVVDVEEVKELWEGSKEPSNPPEPGTKPTSALFCEEVAERLETLQLNESIYAVGEDEAPLPTANSLFADRPEVPFPVNIGAVPDFPPPPPKITIDPLPPQQLPHPTYAAVAASGPPAQTPAPAPVDTFSSLAYTAADMSFDAWIPTEETRGVLESLSTAAPSGILVPEKAHMTMPGIILEDDLVRDCIIHVISHM